MFVQECNPDSMSNSCFSCDVFLTEELHVGVVVSVTKNVNVTALCTGPHIVLFYL